MLMKIVGPAFLEPESYWQCMNVLPYSDFSSHHRSGEHFSHITGFVPSASSPDLGGHLQAKLGS